MKKALAIFILLTTVPLVLYSTEIYVWKDRTGKRHYSDKPVGNGEKLAISPGVAYRVVRFVYDGDTVLLDNRDKVRLSGMNTPEIESRRKTEEPGGEEARLWLKNAIEGKKVRLEGDVERMDRYKRILAHIFVEDGTHINLVLVRLGLATVNLHPPNLKYARQLLNAQQFAERNRLGIWGNPAYAPKPIESLLASKAKGWRRLVGHAVALKRSRKFFRLIYSERIDVRIARVNLGLFPELSTYLERDFEIRGWPSRRKEHYSILVRHPSALRLLESD